MSITKSIMDIINSDHLKNITTILHSIGERIEGNLICDIYPDNMIHYITINKIANLQYLCKDKKKIVEIGVNGCHSLLIMLLENPNAEYLLFDLNNHAYTEPVLNYIRFAFPNTNIKVVFGNSVTTVKEYIENNSAELKTYDLCHLDGGHTEDVFSFDYENMKKLISRDGCVIFDDYNYVDIRNFIQTKLMQNEIVEYKDSNILKTEFHFIYNYV